MNQIEAYTLLFTDVLVSNFAFNTSGEIVFTTMKIFGHYDSKLLIAISLAAYMIAAVINYIYGIICYKILAPVKNDNLIPKATFNKTNEFQGEAAQPILTGEHSLDLQNSFVSLKVANDGSLATNIDNVRNFRLLPLVLAFSCIPFFGKFIVLFSGFCRIKFKMLFFIVLIAKLFYYMILNYVL